MEDSCCCLPGQQALRFVLLLLLLPTLIAGGDMQDVVAKRAFCCAGQFQEEFTDNPGTEHRNRFTVIGLDVAVDIPLFLPSPSKRVLLVPPPSKPLLLVPPPSKPLLLVPRAPTL